ncbi:hypothetical protein N9414_22498, partial [Nodularia spumigena CCY9414]
SLYILIKIKAAVNYFLINGDYKVKRPFILIDVFFKLCLF